MFEHAGHQPPLIIDLDRTMLKTDTLIEQFLILLIRAPHLALRALLSLRHGKAAFKAAIVDHAPINVDALAVNQLLLSYLQQQLSAGRELHLVTAADQRIADAVSQRLGIFRSATGTNRDHNLKGIHKRDYLISAFPSGFSYAGDSTADIPIWKAAKSAVLVGVKARTRRTVEALNCTIEADIEGSDRSLKQWIRLMRVHQWSKNVLIFVPLFLSHRYYDIHTVMMCVLCFAAMSIMASGTYIINDIVDVSADRQHRTKRFRPIAHGDIDAGAASVTAGSMIAAGLFFVANLSIPVFILFIVYLLTTIAYSFLLKRMVMVDVLVLASLYTLRVLIGVVIIGDQLSHWLLMFAFFFFFSLSLAKRHVEIVNAASRNGPDSSILNRGYKTGDAPLTLATGVSTNIASITVLSLYVATDIYPAALYNHPEWLWGVVSMVLIWSTRIWLLAHRGELNDDPVSFALRDPASLAIGFVTASFFALSIV
ncbi:UbiA family prenyltransferase [Aureimonas sp. OT7]|uniref:UbiA family prenyltransferase n=1 Tax=Aureimonas sp. OT7 TaxID=2816454 RepID=UPI00177CD072|nr:UbiA family prenyltransferase [Aureimonas sp. OT7]QOG07127.1 UbiA family prenyltransferase [Aureimonas sp. OT7]